jgi:hypothetical protein
MNHRIRWIAALCCALGVAAPALPKEAVVKLGIEGPTLAAPIEITDPAVIRQFNIWNGPGVRVNDQPVHLDPAHTEGMFIDWPKGAATPPAGLRELTVTFYMESYRNPGPMHGWYVIKYAFDPSAPGGFIYLPGQGDPDFGRNVSSIIHGVEGQWFHSTQTWEELVRSRVTED